MDEIFVAAFIDEMDKVAEEKKSRAGEALGTAAAVGGTAWAGGHLAEAFGKKRPGSRIGKWGRRAGLGGAAIMAGTGLAEIARRLARRRKEKT